MADTPYTDPRFHGPDNPCNSYPLALNEIANQTILAYRILLQFNPRVTLKESIFEVFDQLEADARNAVQHLGAYRFGITSEQKYRAQFLAMVVNDARNDVTRPRTGNILDAVYEAVDKKYQNFLESGCTL